MGKENSVLTIDIGSRSLRMAEFLFQEGGISLTKFLSRRIELGEEEIILDTDFKEVTEIDEQVTLEV